MKKNDESYLADLADSISDKGRAFACDTGLLSLYRSFCLYSPFSLLLQGGTINSLLYAGLQHSFNTIKGFYRDNIKAANYAYGSHLP